LPNPARLVFVAGAPAVGKMTVGQELERLTGTKLLFNHQIIDLLSGYFEFGSDPFWRLADLIRVAFLAEAAAVNLSINLTIGVYFELQSDHEIVNRYADAYRTGGGSVYMVELAAPLDVRLARNLTENRRAHKNVVWATDEVLRALDAEHKHVSTPGEFPFDFPHLTIDTTRLEAAATAQLIADWLASDPAAD